MTQTPQTPDPAFVQGVADQFGIAIDALNGLYSDLNRYRGMFGTLTVDDHNVFAHAMTDIVSAMGDLRTHANRLADFEAARR